MRRLLQVGHGDARRQFAGWRLFQDQPPIDNFSISILRKLGIDGFGRLQQSRSQCLSEGAGISFDTCDLAVLRQFAIKGVVVDQLLPVVVVAFNARLSSDQAHLRSELHRLETEARSLRTTRERLAASEQKNQQLEERLTQTTAQLDELLAENQNYAAKLLDATQAGFCLESELAAAKAVLASHEQILEKLIVSQSATQKGSGSHKGGDENQKSLLDPGK